MIRYILDMIHELRIDVALNDVVCAKTRNEVDLATREVRRLIRARSPQQVARMKVIKDQDNG